MKPQKEGRRFGSIEKVDPATLSEATKAYRAEKVKPEEDRNLRWFKGYASYRSVDRDGELILPTAFEKSIKPFMDKLPAVTLGHEFDAARAVNIGRITDMTTDAKGLKVEGYLGTNDAAKDVRTNLDEDIPMAFSIAFNREKWRDPNSDEMKEHGESLRMVTESVELLPIGIVNAGSNRDTLVLAKGIVSKGAVEALNEVMAYLGAAVEKLNAIIAGGEQPTEQPQGQSAEETGIDGRATPSPMQKEIVDEANRILDVLNKAGGR